MRRALAAAALVASVALNGCESKSTHDSNTAVAQPGIDDTHYAGRAYAGDSVHGKLVFDTNCATCHGAGGRSGGVGPPLIEERQRMSLEQTIVWIENPDPPMPALYPSPLSETDVADVAAFVQTIK
jgi:mono/diheme cytochrome c family protein